MGMTMRVSLPGIDALTNGTIDQYALYADSDNVLIKEFARGTMAIADSASGTVTHNFGYTPFFMVYTTTGAGTWQISNAFDPVGAGWRSIIGTDNLVVQNRSGASGTVQYYLFYDNVT